MIIEDVPLSDRQVAMAAQGKRVSLWVRVRCDGCGREFRRNKREAERHVVHYHDTRCAMLNAKRNHRREKIVRALHRSLDTDMRS